MDQSQFPESRLFVLSPRAAARLPAVLMAITLLVIMIQNWRPFLDAGVNRWPRLGLVLLACVAGFVLMWGFFFLIFGWWRIRVGQHGVEVRSGIGRPELVAWNTITHVGVQGLWGVTFLRLRSPNTGRILSIALP